MPELNTTQHNPPVNKGLIKCFAELIDINATNEGKKSFRFKIITDRINRNGRKYHPAGVDIAPFLKNPVFLMQHNSRDVPLGKVINIEKTKTGMFADVIFHGETDESILYEKLYAGKYLNAVSVGMHHTEFSRKPIPKNLIGKVFDVSWGNNQYKDVTQSELWELSAVTIPAEPEAVLKKISKNSLDFSNNEKDMITNILMNTDQPEINNDSTNEGESMPVINDQEKLIETQAKRIIELEENLDKNAKEILDSKNAKIEELEKELLSNNEGVKSLKETNKVLKDENTKLIEDKATLEEQTMKSSIDSELDKLVNENKILPKEKESYSEQLLILKKAKVKQGDELMSDVIMNGLKDREPNKLGKVISGNNPEADSSTKIGRRLNANNVHDAKLINDKLESIMKEDNKLTWDSAREQAVKELEGK